MIATNAVTMRERNKRLILQLILKNGFSRAELAEHTSLTKAGISVIVEELIAGGTVIEDKSEKTAVGRRPIRLAVNPDAMYAIGINLKRNGTDVGLVDIGGHVLCEKSLDVLPPQKTLELAHDEIRDMIKKSGIAPDRLFGIGITAPGPLDSQSTTILNPPSFEDWHYMNVGSRFENLLGMPCHLENISGALALCEKYYGKAKDISDFLLLTVGDGIGSGIVIGERLSKNASEIGHTSIQYNGRPCKCGNVGCVERYASIPAILEGSPYGTWAEVIDAEDVALIQKEAEYLTCAIINAVNTLGLRDVILDGDIGYKPQRLMAEIQQRLTHNTITKTPPSLSVSSGFHPVLCAATTVFDHYFSSL